MNHIMRGLLHFVKRSAEKTAVKASPKGMFEAVVPRKLRKK